MEKRRVVLWYALLLILLVGTDHGVRAATHVEKGVKERTMLGVTALLNAAIYRLSGEKPDVREGEQFARLDVFGKPLPSLPDFDSTGDRGGGGLGALRGKVPATGTPGRTTADDAVDEHLRMMNDLLSSDFKLFSDDDQSLDGPEADLLLENFAQEFAKQASLQGVGAEHGWSWPWSKDSPTPTPTRNPMAHRFTQSQSVRQDYVTRKNHDGAGAVPVGGIPETETEDFLKHETRAVTETSKAPNMSALDGLMTRFRSMLSGMAQSKDENSLSVKDVILAILFGFVNGFFSGLGDMLRDAIRHPSCAHLFDDLMLKFSEMTGAWGDFFIGLFSKTVRAGRSRTDLFKSAASRSLTFLKSIVSMVTKCRPLYVILGTMIAVIAVALIITMALAATVYGILIKIAEIVMTVYFGIEFFWKTLKKFAHNAACLTSTSTCTRHNKVAMVEAASEFVGLIVGAIMMSGLDKLVEIQNLKSIFKGGGLKGVKVKFDPGLEKEFRALVKHMNAKKQRWSTMGNSFKAKMFQIKGALRKGYRKAANMVSDVGDNISNWWGRLTKRTPKTAAKPKPTRPRPGAYDHLDAATPGGGQASVPSGPDVSKLSKKEIKKITQVQTQADEMAHQAVKARKAAETDMHAVIKKMNDLAKKNPRPSNFEEQMKMLQTQMERAEDLTKKAIASEMGANSARREVGVMMDDFVRDLPKNLTPKQRHKMISAMTESVSRVHISQSKLSGDVWKLKGLGDQIETAVGYIKNHGTNPTLTTRLKTMMAEQDELMSAVLSSKTQLDNILKTAVTSSDDPYTRAFWGVFSNSVENTQYGVASSWIYKAYESLDSVAPKLGSFASEYLPKLRLNANKLSKASGAAGAKLSSARNAFRQATAGLGEYFKSFDDAKGLVQSAMLAKNTATVTRTAAQVASFKYQIKIRIVKALLNSFRPKGAHQPEEILNKVTLMFQQKGINTGYSPGLTPLWNENLTIYTDAIDDVKFMFTSTTRSLQAKHKTFAMGNLPLSHFSPSGKNYPMQVDLLAFDPSEPLDEKTLTALKEPPQLFIDVIIKPNPHYNEKHGTLKLRARTHVDSDRRTALRQS
eukprot:TRINITY_DN676_c0_g4_i2.p1 TRINITY_DN676_c0_g4~~TRINITY_DN676_c0_g4_i2.p1  ORF type:complete len:1083 (-),score=337.92 TRINITY_DN676_c0_g4_i2:180-3428(-)